MIERITADNILLALILRRNFNKKGGNFVTAQENPLQLGIFKYNPGEIIRPHNHRRINRHIKTTQEILYIVRGKVKVDLFFKNKRIVSKILKEGDTILLANGGHGFKFLSDTEILEVKQGPYIDKGTDKRYLKIR
ncbi:MAG: hypothetical protein NC920_03275 [Candidatus Omnitrophica bacterium]|nr:hypothetical protein [Candidatus Omnitrophota bacterium]